MLDNFTMLNNIRYDVVTIDQKTAFLQMAREIIEKVFRTIIVDTW